MTDTGACIVTTETPLLAPAAERASDITRRWRSYDDGQHLLRDVSVDAEGQPLGLYASSNTSSYAMLNGQGRTLTSAWEVGQGTLERSDYARDLHGNVISYRQSRTSARGLNVPPEDPSLAYDFVNHYEPSGLLRKHARADSSATINYTHDSNGRCEHVVDDVWIEQREYDSNGRLSTQRVDPVDPGAASKLASSITTHRYDDEGRPLAVEQDGGGSLALPIDGQPDILTLWSYAADGGWFVEHIDFSSDTPNDSVDRDGQLASAWHRWESWSPGCAAVQASIPRPTAEACVTD